MQRSLMRLVPSRPDLCKVHWAASSPGCWARTKRIEQRQKHGAHQKWTASYMHSKTKAWCQRVGLVCASLYSSYSRGGE